MSGLHELYPFVRRVDRHLALAHIKLDRMLSMLEVLIAQLVEPVALPDQRRDMPIARDEIARAESLLRIIESRMRGLVRRRGGPQQR